MPNTLGEATGRTATSPSAVSPRRGDVARTVARDLAPVVGGLAPFGVLVGVTSVQSGVGERTGLLSSVLLFGGSGQLTMMTLTAAGATPLAVAAAVAVVNARFLLYAAALEPHFRSQPRWFRWAAPHFVVDPMYALVSRRTGLTEPAGFRAYWLSAAVGLLASWLGLTALGAALAGLLPAASPLDVAAPAMFLAMLMPLLRTRPGRVGAAVAAATTVTASPLPAGLGMLCGIAAGMLAGDLATRSRP
jgi:predicted branched-subunit amino acid permease